MKRLLCIGILTACCTVAWAQAPGARVPDHYVVQLRAGAQPAAVAGRLGLAPTYVYNRAINGFAAFVPPGRVAAVAADPDVASMHPDYVVTAIGKGGGGSGKPGGGDSTTAPLPQVTPAGVQRVGPAGALTGFGVGVAIVDTGIDFNHADLAPLGSASFNAFKTAAPGQDDNGHGTHVSGIAAARDNDIDTVGVAPEATLYAVKVLDRRGFGSDSTIIAGLNWVMNNVEAVSPPIRVVNMSLGRAASGDDSAMYSAIQNVVDSGVAVVVAAGNDCGKEISQQVPAGFANVLAVASTTAKEGVNAGSYNNGTPIPADTASYFTTDGEGVAISAPGEDQEDVARNNFLKGVGILSTKLGGGVTRMSGTSMASPHVAGALARLIGQVGPLSPALARTILARHSENWGIAPFNGVTTCASFDGAREGVLSAANMDREDLPVANSGLVSTPEDTPVSIALASDSNGDNLTIDVTQQPAFGTLSINGGVAIYSPAANFNGSDSIEFAVSDGIWTVLGSVAIDVTSVNDAPIADARNVTTVTDAPVDITLTGSDLEGSPLTFTVTVGPNHGTLTGIAPNLTYTPELSFSGTDTFTFIVNDGLADSSPATVMITVETPPPVAP